MNLIECLLWISQEFSPEFFKKSSRDGIKHFLRGFCFQIFFHGLLQKCLYEFVQKFLWCFHQNSFRDFPDISFRNSSRDYTYHFRNYSCSFFRNSSRKCFEYYSKKLSRNLSRLDFSKGKITSPLETPAGIISKHLMGSFLENPLRFVRWLIDLLFSPCEIRSDILTEIALESFLDIPLKITQKSSKDYPEMWLSGIFHRFYWNQSKNFFSDCCFSKDSFRISLLDSSLI